MDKRNDPALAKLIVGATVATVAISSVAILALHYSLTHSDQMWPMVLCSSVATILVMGMLHAELQRLYRLKTASELRAKQEALIDSLTGIGNRRSITQALDSTCNEADIDPDRALLLIDLDGFKRVNDTLGHHCGDELITAVARRLGESVPGAEIGRLGGDEFAIIMEARDMGELAAGCQHISAGFEEPFELSYGQCYAGGSIGACMITANSDASDILHRADLALYDAKAGGSGFCVFDEAMSQHHDRRARLMRDLGTAIESGDGLFAHFQPIESSAGVCVGLEAFLRWKHPKLGLIAPIEVVSLAEQSQLIGSCERIITREALEAAKELSNLQIFLNVSGLQMLDASFAKWLNATAKASHIAPSRIVVELREQAIAERSSQFVEAFDYLRQSGFRIAVDCFGANLTSLSDLKAKGVSILKLDRKFILEAQQQSNISVLRASVHLAQTLGMEVVATGTDTHELRALAEQAGCDLFQGYHIGVPDKLSELNLARRAA